MQSDVKKRIAVNTVMLYIRMIIVMLISLFTSRKVLEVLGVDDYGIYNVVGGVVSMLSFLNSSMTVATQRFLTFELGRKDLNRYRTVFSMAFGIHCILAVIVLVLAETAGLWLVNTHLVIPEERMWAANWVYQTSVLVMLVSIVRTPYNAAIISHERMGIYAYVSIFEVVLKLLIVYLLLFLPYDKLAVYGVLGLAVQLLVAFIYFICCRRNWTECRLRVFWDRGIFKSMAGFTGWNMFGTVAWILKDQGVNILMNMFSGPAVNAARGISVQVSGAVKNLVSGFQTAVNPQITKTYASGKRQEMHLLLRFSSKVSFYMLLCLALPLGLEAPYILDLWLVEVPEYAVLFTRIILLEVLLDTLSGPMITGLMATGKIKWYQIVVGGILLLNIPVSYALLRCGLPIYLPLIVSCILTAAAIVIRQIFASKMLSLPLGRYTRSVLLPVFAVAVLSPLVPYLIMSHISAGFARLAIVTASAVVSVLLTAYLAGFDRSERNMLCGIVRNIVKRKTI